MPNGTLSGPETTFDVVHNAAPSETLLAGFSEFGLAGLTAVDYLVDQLDLEPTGHVTAEGLPAITPFSEGVARHHTRLFSRLGLDFTVLVGELFVPHPVTASFAEAILEWTETNAVSELAVLSGVPIPHGPDEHHTFYVATEGYREERLANADVRPMGSGFLDGVNGDLMARGLDSALDVCVLTTPVHAQAPDIEAAIRLVEATKRVYDLGIDTDPLQSLAGDVRERYQRLAERVERVEEEYRPEDQMFM